MYNIECIEDIQKLIEDQVQESLYLDYKRSAALDYKKKNEITKDVCAFANSDGGQIIYGVKEEDDLPVEIDNGTDFSRDRLEQLIESNISPPIEGLKIVAISVGAKQSVFCITIPKSYTGPHQSGDKKYYRRQNFKSKPMEHYEIEEARARQVNEPQLVTMFLETANRIAHFVIANVGNLPAYDVRFSFDPPLEWRDDRPLPKQFSDGIECLNPGMRLSFIYGVMPSIFSDPENIPAIKGNVTYRHPILNKRFSYPIDINFENYRGSVVTQSDMDKLISALDKNFNELSKSIEKVANELGAISRISGPTGLEISERSISSLRSLFNENEKIIRRSPYGLPSIAFRQILDVDTKTALHLADFFSWKKTSEEFKTHKGISDELKKKILERFWID